MHAFRFSHSYLPSLHRPERSQTKKGEKSPYDKVRRLSSPGAWDIALVPFPEDFAPLPTQAETGLACPVS